MLSVLLILVAIVSVIIVLIILAQNPKGGGLSGTFGGTASQIVGTRKAADFFEKSTWYLAIGILGIILISNFFLPSIEKEESKESLMKDQIENMQAPLPPQEMNTNPNTVEAEEKPQEQPKN